MSTRNGWQLLLCLTVLHDGGSSEKVVKDAVLAAVENSMASGELAASVDVDMVATKDNTYVVEEKESNDNEDHETTVDPF